MGRLIVINGPTEIERKRDERRRLREALREAEGERDLVERQFVDGDLIVTAGPRKGQPLLARGRRQRLNRLLWLHRHVGRLRDEITELDGEIARLVTVEKLKSQSYPLDLGDDTDPAS